MTTNEPYRIYIVEDERLVQIDLKHKIEALGYEVAGMASSGEVAVADAASLRPDLVIMDVRLRGAMDGFEAAARIWQSVRIPIVFLTAYCSLPLPSDFPREATVFRLDKPFSAKDLEKTLRGCARFPSRPAFP